MHRLTVGYVCFDFMKGILMATYEGIGEGECKVHKAVYVLHDKCS